MQQKPVTCVCENKVHNLYVLPSLECYTLLSNTDLGKIKSSTLPQPSLTSISLE